MPHPVDNLIRINPGPDALRWGDASERSSGDASDMSTIHGHFAVFNTWTEIRSVWEGEFLERIAPGAFAESFADSSQVRLLFEHGRDPQIGNKPLGTFTSLREDKTGARYEGRLFDADYVNQLKPALAAGQLGASFRFSVTSEEWVEPTAATDHNPAKLPERTITGVRLFEAGPVVWGAYPDATAGLRSGTDEFHDRLLSDPDFVARFIERVGPKVAGRMITNAAADGPAPNASAAADGPGVARGRLVASARTSLATLRGGVNR